MANTKYNQLTARRVASLSAPGRYNDGRGLMLFIDSAGNRRWVLRVTVDGRRRDLGLGSAEEVSLAEARDRRDEIRRTIRAGVDPLADKKRKRGAKTFEVYARALHKQILGEWKNRKHAAQWLSTLEDYAFPKFGARRLDEIDGAMIRAALEPIWDLKAETARRVKQRIGRVLSAATAEGLRSGPNPVLDISSALGKKKPRVEHHAAMPYAEVPAFFSALAASDMTASGRAAFQLLVLTAARTSEVLLAEWPEIDLAGALWTIPAARMKMAREHVVPLSPAAVAALTTARAHADGSKLIFPGSRRGKPFSNMVFAAALKRMGVGFTAHGFRSSFRDWAEERTSFPHAVKEAALAHAVKDKVEAAYRRTNLLEQRRLLMIRWAEFLIGGDNV